MQMCGATGGSVRGGGWGKAIQGSSKHQEVGRNTERTNEHGHTRVLKMFGKKNKQTKKTEEDRLIQVLRGSKKPTRMENRE